MRRTDRVVPWRRLVAALAASAVVVLLLPTPAAAAPEDLTITVSVNNTNAAYGATVVVTIQVQNSGPTTEVAVRAHIPWGVGEGLFSDTPSITASQGLFSLHTGGSSAGTLTWDPTVASGDSETLVLSAPRVRNLGFEIEAHVEPNQHPQNQDSVTMADRLSDLAVDTSFQNNPAVGGTATIRVTVSNNGPAGANGGVRVTSKVPSGLTYLSSSGPGTYSPSTGVWSLSGPITSARTLQINARRTSAAAITTTATVAVANTSIDSDNVSGNNSDSATLPARPTGAAPTTAPGAPTTPTAPPSASATASPSGVSATATVSPTVGGVVTSIAAGPGAPSRSGRDVLAYVLLGVGGALILGAIGVAIAIWGRRPADPAGPEPPA